MMTQRRAVCLCLGLAMLAACTVCHADGDAGFGVFDRVTARSFADTPVSQADIDLLVEAAFAAPTGGDQRDCELFVVTDRSVMSAMQANHPYAQALRTAPLVMVVAVDTVRANYPELLSLDTGMAAQNILVLAAQLGLASVPMSIAPQAERMQGVSAALALPDRIEPQIMIAIGYPETDAVSSASTTHEYQHKVHYNQYEAGE